MTRLGGKGPSKIMFSLSSLFFFGITENARSGFLFFLIFTTRVDPNKERNTMLPMVSALEKEVLSLLLLGGPQKHFGNSGRFGPLPKTQDPPLFFDHGLSMASHIRIRSHSLPSSRGLEQSRSAVPCRDHPATAALARGCLDLGRLRRKRRAASASTDDRRRSPPLRAT